MLHNPVLQSLLLFYSHSWLKLTWQETKQPLRGLVVISVIASCAVQVALLWAASPGTAHPRAWWAEGAEPGTLWPREMPGSPKEEPLGRAASPPCARLTWVAAGRESLNTRLCSALSPFFSRCFVRGTAEVAGAELFTFKAKYFVCWRKWPLKWFVK